MIAQNLDLAIRAVCPILGVSIGRADDKQTWRIDYDPVATTLQRAAAQAVVDGFDAQAASTPLDISDIDNLDRVLKALGLCIAQVGGLTVPQMKALFKSKYDQLA